jgi:hypothetical protein
MNEGKIKWLAKAFVNRVFGDYEANRGIIEVLLGDCVSEEEARAVVKAAGELL